MTLILFVLGQADAAKFEKRMEAAETRLYNNERGLAKGEMEFLTTEVIGSKHLVDEKNALSCFARNWSRIGVDWAYK